MSRHTNTLNLILSDLGLDDCGRVGGSLISVSSCAGLVIGSGCIVSCVILIVYDQFCPISCAVPDF